MTTNKRTSFFHPFFIQHSIAADTWVDTILPFVIGGLSGMTATSVIQPIDTVKVRIQIKGEEGIKNASPFAVAREIRAHDGVKGFYKGIDSALFRQATYATARLGIYKTLSDYLKHKNGSIKTN
jgi:solute carrier family 25 oxoglutarate transporter 11